ncbi:MAG: ATP-binding cassette domain-containing protein [Acidobacteria bacterium]|nr:ATP-binding cassette domain-containing protein [Acidobacteriota bacterium]
MLSLQTEESVIKDEIIEEELEPTDLEDAVDEPERIVPAIEFRDVILSFDDKVILDGVSFTVRRGETKVILGRSGGGKSTTIRLILGLLKPDSGQILIDGEDITDYSEVEMMEVRKKIGMIFQEGALFDSLSVYDNVAYRLHEQGVAEEEVENEVRRARTICELAIKLRDLQDVSSIFVTHEMNNVEILSNEYAVVDENGEVVYEEEGEKLCLTNTEIVMFNQGKIIFSGKEEEFRATKDPYILKFMRGK